MSREFHSSVVFKLEKRGIFAQNIFLDNNMWRKRVPNFRGQIFEQNIYVTLEVRLNIQFVPFHQSRLKNEQEDLGY